MLAQEDKLQKEADIGGIVLNDVPDDRVAVDNPARIVKPTKMTI